MEDIVSEIDKIIEKGDFAPKSYLNNEAPVNVEAYSEYSQADFNPGIQDEEDTDLVKSRKKDKKKYKGTLEGSEYEEELGANEADGIELAEHQQEQTLEQARRLKTSVMASQLSGSNHGTPQGALARKPDSFLTGNKTQLMKDLEESKALETRIKANERLRAQETMNAKGDEGF
mmetsp:Transcript_30295/g.46325  ORF Transcript_30295/g.46325 Transcript_30295/m.46325 type:complete len:174 (+) Transcript_30295:2488-3009(+)